MALTIKNPLGCSVCGDNTQQPLLICLECNEGTDINGVIALTGYCGTTCRDSDKDHPQLCKRRNERKCLYRAGDLLQAAFYEWRETAFDIKIKSVWKKDGILCFQEDEYETGVSLYRFPAHLFDNPQDKQKMLSYSACTDAQAHLFGLSKRLLEDLVSEAYELSMTVDRPRHAIVRHFVWGVDTKTYPHQVLGVMLDDQEEYIIDLSGAQHGQHRTVVPSGQYMTKCADNCTKKVKFGSEAGLQPEYIAREIKEGKHGVWRTGAEMRLRMKAAIDEWESSGSQTVQQLLTGSAKNYEEGKAALLGKIHDALQKFMVDMELGRWFVS